MVKVSVVVPVYNVEKYLKRCLDSLVNQTLKDIEIIIVNDGSLDNSPKICEEYKRKYSNIKYISQENQGLSAARNAGIEIAIGDYIGFVDSDDFVKEDMFSFLYNNAIENNVEISCCGHETYYDDNTTKLNTKKGIKKLYSKEEALDYFLLQEYFDVVTWNKIYKRELFKNIRFPVGKIYEDIQTIYKLIYLSDGLYFDSTPKYFYYKRKDSISNAKFNKDTLKLINYIDDYVDFCDKNLNYKKNIYLGQIRWYLVIVNKMIAEKNIDENLINKLRKIINKNIWLVLFTNKVPLIRKFQILLFRVSFKTYKKIYIKEFC